MAKGGNIHLDIDFKPFERYLQAALDHVETGSKKATIAACEEIKKMTLQEVPRASNTLASSFFYNVEGKYRNFEATLGYGGPNDRVNPKTGQKASEYMIAVHEDLDANHPNGGKAKFLEDPLREYHERFAIRAALEIRNELGG
jgi:hypothetical protein